MGYELTLFTDKVDEELQCSICTMVLEQPIQTRCEHFFCFNCIQEWLAVKKVCPMDGGPLTPNDIHPPNRLLRNLLNKLSIRCRYCNIGCFEIIRLDNLDNHCAACPFNPDAIVKCDKGCNLLMPRRECNAYHCLEHYDKLVGQQNNVIQRLTNENKLVRIAKDSAEREVERLKAVVKKVTNSNNKMKSYIIKIDK